MVQKVRHCVDEAARRLGGISKWTIHAWLSQGRLQRTKVGGRTMIRESELAKVIEKRGQITITAENVLMSDEFRTNRPRPIAAGTQSKA